MPSARAKSHVEETTLPTRVGDGLDPPVKKAILLLNAHSDTPGHSTETSFQRHLGNRAPPRSAYGLMATPQGSRPTGTDFSAFKVSTSMTVRSLVRPLAT